MTKPRNTAKPFAKSTLLTLLLLAAATMFPMMFAHAETQVQPESQSHAQSQVQSESQSQSQSQSQPQPQVQPQAKAALPLAQAASPIVILQQPVNTTYLPGETATFSVVVENPDNYTYQWYIEDEANATWYPCYNYDDTPVESTSKPTMTTAVLGWAYHDKNFKCKITSKADDTVFLDTDVVTLTPTDADKFWEPFVTVGPYGLRAGQTLNLPDGGTVTFSEDTFTITLDNANIRFFNEDLWPMDQCGMWVSRYYETTESAAAAPVIKTPVTIRLIGENNLITKSPTGDGSGMMLFDLEGLEPADETGDKATLQKSLLDNLLKDNGKLLLDTDRSNDGGGYVNKKHTLRKYNFTGDANSKMNISGDLGITTVMGSGAQIGLKGGTTVNLSNAFCVYGIDVDEGSTLNIANEEGINSGVYGHDNRSNMSLAQNFDTWYQREGLLFGLGAEDLGAYEAADGGDVVVTGNSTLNFNLNHARGMKSPTTGVLTCYGLDIKNSLRVSNNSTLTGTMVYNPLSFDPERNSNNLIVAVSADNIFEANNSTVDIETRFSPRTDLSDVVAVGGLVSGMGMKIDGATVNARVDTTPVNNGYVVTGLRTNGIMTISGGAQVSGVAKASSSVVDGVLSTGAMTITNSNVTGTAEGYAAVNGIGTLGEGELSIDITDERYQVVGMATATGAAPNNEARGLGVIKQKSIDDPLGYDESYAPTQIKLLNQAVFLAPNKRAAVLNQSSENNYDEEEPLGKFTVYETVYDKNDKLKPAAHAVVGIAKKYAIGLSATENGRITASAAVSEAGEIISLTVEPVSGYSLTQIQVNGAPLVGTSFVMPDKDVNITAQFDKIPGPAPAPQPPVGKNVGFASGTSSAWSKGAKSGLSMRVAKDISQFYAVIVDGAVLDGANYTVASGSTVVTLRPAYLATLASGKHAVRILFQDGNFAEMEFTVGGKGGTTVARVPVTGDTAQPVALALLALASLGGMAAIVIKRRNARG